MLAAIGEALTRAFPKDPLRGAAVPSIAVKNQDDSLHMIEFVAVNGRVIQILVEMAPRQSWLGITWPRCIGGRNPGHREEME